MSKIRYFNGSSWKEIDADIPSNIEYTTNKVTSVSAASTDTQYPSAKLLYNLYKDAKETYFFIERGDTTASKIDSLVYALDNGKPVICVGTAATYDEGTVYVAQIWDDNYKTVKFMALDDSDPPYLTTVTLDYTPGSVLWDSSAIQLQTKLIDYGAAPNFKTLTINGDEYSMLGGGTINIPTGGGSSDLFECTYGTTTYAQITQAISEGKLPYVFRNNIFYLFTNMTESAINFRCLQGTLQVGYITLTSPNSWGSAGYSNAERASNKVTSWQATPDNTHYPSEKLVYDTIQSVIGSGVTSYLLDLDTYAYESNVYTITGIDLTNATKITLLPDATQDTTWFYASVPVSMPHITAITASGFQITDIGNTPAGRKLILTVYS